MAKGLEAVIPPPSPKNVKKKHKISYKEINYYTFGKFILNRKILNDENILLIKYPKSHGNVPKLRRTIISDTFKNLINDLLDTQQLNIQIQKNLTDKEQDLLDLLLSLSLLKKQLNFSKQYKDINDYVIRFKILQGSISAGNDSDDIKNELIDIINILSNPIINKISIDNAIMLKDCLM